MGGALLLRVWSLANQLGFPMTPQFRTTCPSRMFVNSGVFSRLKTILQLKLNTSARIS